MHETRRTFSHFLWITLNVAIYIPRRLVLLEENVANAGRVSRYLVWKHPLLNPHYFHIYCNV